MSRERELLVKASGVMRAIDTRVLPPSVAVQLADTEFEIKKLLSEPESKPKAKKKVAKKKVAKKK